jgi:hypothetical protein
MTADGCADNLIAGVAAGHFSITDEVLTEMGRIVCVPGAAVVVLFFLLDDDSVID